MPLQGTVQPDDASFEGHVPVGRRNVDRRLLYLIVLTRALRGKCAVAAQNPWQKAFVVWWLVDDDDQSGRQVVRQVLDYANDSIHAARRSADHDNTVSPHSLGPRFNIDCRPLATVDANAGIMQRAQMLQSSDSGANWRAGLVLVTQEGRPNIR